jgi:hypothetical protein
MSSHQASICRAESSARSGSPDSSWCASSAHAPACVPGRAAANRGRFQNLIGHWNGTAWKQVPSPNPLRENGLSGVAATSAANAWAVGGAVILHWNGTRWRQVRNPASTGGRLSAVASTSRTNAWAVGGSFNGVKESTLIERWNGTTWKRVPT